MSDIDSVKSYTRKLGIDYKSVKKLELNNDKNAEIAAKYEALQNPGSEIIIKQNNSYYLAELPDSVKLSDLLGKVDPKNKQFVALNLVDKDKHENVGNLYNINTLQTGVTLLDKAEHIFYSNKPDPEKGFLVGSGYFKINLDDKNGFSIKGDNDLKIAFNTRVEVTTEQLADYLNKELISPTSGIYFDIRENLGKWNLAVKLKDDTKPELADKINDILLGEKDSLRRKLGENTNIQEKIDELSKKLINSLEKRLNINLPKEKLTDILTGTSDAKKGIPEFLKEGISKEYIEKILKDESGAYQEFIPDFAFRKMSEFAKLKIDSYIDKIYKKDSFINTRDFVREAYQMFGYSISDTEVDTLTTTALAKIDGNKLQINFNVNGQVSTGKQNGDLQGKPDNLKLEGAFNIMSKGKAEFLGGTLKTDATIDISKINKSTVVALAESLGSDGDMINTELIRNPKKVTLKAESEVNALSDGVYNTALSIKDFSEKTFGTSIKGMSGFVDTDITESGKIKLTSGYDISIDEAILISGYKASENIFIEQLRLTKPQNSKSSLNIGKFNSSITRDGADISAENIKTGIDLKVKVNNQNISLNVNELNIKSSKLKVGFDKGSILSASGKDLKMSDVKASAGDINVSFGSISVQKGNGTVELSDSGKLEVTGSGIKIDNIKWKNVSADIETEGNSSVISSNGKFHIDSPAFKGKLRIKNEAFEFSGNNARIDIDSSSNKVVFNTSKTQDCKFILKSKSHDIATEFKIPKGTTGEIDLKSMTIKVKGQKGKELEAVANLKDYSGKSLGVINIKSEDKIEARFGKFIDIKPSSKAVTINGNIKIKDEDISFTGKFNGGIRYSEQNLTYQTKSGDNQSLEVSAKGKKFSIETSDQADISVDLQKNDIPLKVSAGNSSSPVNLKFKADDIKTSENDAEINLTLSNKASFSVLPDNENISMKINPPSRNPENNEPGLKINGKMNTEFGLVNINQLEISNSSTGSNLESEVGISSEGLKFKGNEMELSGNVSLTRNGDNPRNINFKGNVAVKDADYDFKSKILNVNNAFYSGTVNNLKVNFEGGLNGKNKEATYNAEISSNTDTLRLKGNLLVKELSKDNISLSGRTGISLTVGKSEPANYIVNIKDFSLPLNRGNKIFNTDLQVLSATKKDNKLIPDKNLSIDGSISLDKTSDGYVLNLPKTIVSSKDTLKTAMVQIASIMKQPQIANELSKKGINISNFEKIQEKLNKYLVSSDLSTTSSISVNLSNDFDINNISFNSKIDSVKINFPILRHTKQKGFSIGAKAGESMYQLNESVNVSGKVSLSGKAPVVNATAKINLNEILPKLIEEQFSSPESPLRGKIKVKMEGNKIDISDAGNKFFSSMSFGLKDIDIKIDGNKAEITLKVNFIKGLYDSVRFALSDDVKLKREWKTITGALDSMKSDSSPGFFDIINSNKITIDIPEVTKNLDLPLKLGGNIILNNGYIEIPVSS